MVREKITQNSRQTPKKMTNDEARMTNEDYILATTELLVAQGFDRIHLGGAIGRIESEDDADGHGNAEGER